MEALYRFEASVTETVAVGLVPEGVRLDVHFAGQVTAGPFTGGRLRGIDYLLLRADGVGSSTHSRLSKQATGGLCLLTLRVTSCRRRAWSFPRRTCCSHQTSLGPTFRCQCTGSCFIEPALRTWRTSIAPRRHFRGT